MHNSKCFHPVGIQSSLTESVWRELQHLATDPVSTHKIYKGTGTRQEHSGLAVCARELGRLSMAQVPITRG